MFRVTPKMSTSNVGLNCLLFTQRAFRVSPNIFDSLGSAKQGCQHGSKFVDIEGQKSSCSETLCRGCSTPASQTSRLIKRQFSTSQKHLLAKVDSSKDYYSVLGVTHKCSIAKVKQAFYRLSKLYHPDINKTPQALKKFHDITEAYEVLSNARLRQQYEDSRGHHLHGHHGDMHRGPKAPSPKHFRPQGPIQTGKTAEYNYDEWTKHHYKESFNKTQRFKSIREDPLYEEHLHDTYVKPENEKQKRMPTLFGFTVSQENYLAAFLAIALFCGFWKSYDYESMKVKQSKDSEKESE